MTSPGDALLTAVIGAQAAAYALIHRPGIGPGTLEVLVGEPVTAGSLAEVPLPPLAAAARPDVLAVVPYRQIGARGLTCVDDGAPLVAIQVRRHATVRLDRAVRLLPRDPARLGPGGFDLDDDAYEAAVRAVLAREIGCGTGSNFVLSRTFHSRLGGPADRQALAAFRRLLRSEQGTYWTFLVHWEGRTLLGASPECQVGLAGGVAIMNPISGTYRHPAGGPTPRGLRRFLADGKETDELFMVVDEELKMMADICEGGARLRGPRLRPMSRLTHTEYLIEGATRLDPRQLLARTMPAPTVTGSPVTAAARVVAEHERTGRGYYGGAVALFGQRAGRRTLDAALLIRTADVRADRRLSVRVGATLVRHSDPAAEAAETWTKAASLLRAFGHEVDARGPAVRSPAFRWSLRSGRTARLLSARNEGLSRFWRGSPDPPARPRHDGLRGRRLLILDAEDDFTAMLATMARTLGVAVELRPVPAAGLAWTGGPPPDVVLLGPGPGDPRDRTDPRIAALRDTAGDLLAGAVPFLAVCLGHQVVCDALGLPIRRLPVPAQGVQREVPVFGRAERVGFYNTFTATSASDRLHCPVTSRPVRVSRDPRTGAVHALEGHGMRSVQFHVESVLTENGLDILGRMLVAVLSESNDARPPSAGDRRVTGRQP
ncbi:anthranilate synthase family protein [Dactylosporangium cerinum]|uniref:anthranilate synthase n=1 Tax=Dactylosporangium cerinum TaxID=1434730 RepID=A0ABV9WGW1_9ACTN